MQLSSGRRSWPRHRRGFALLLTLAVLVIAVSALGMLARQSLAAVAAATSAEDELRRKWICISAQDTLLPAAPMVLQREEQRRGAVRQCLTTLEIGPQRVELLFTDEQACLNLNRVYALEGRAAAAAAAAQLSPESRAVFLQPCLDALPGSAHRPLHSLDQVYAPALTADNGRAEWSPARQVTVWGSGKLQLRRANPNAANLLCSPTLDVNELSELQRMAVLYPGLSLSQLASRLQLTLAKEYVVMEHLTTESCCHSLLVRVSDPTGTASRMAVAERKDDGSIRMDTLEW